MSKKPTEKTNVTRPPQYFNQNKNQKFNLQTLLTSGKYFLDEFGFLVAPNGTRYRIPSGPPEGRKPLRLDKTHLSKLDLNYSTLPLNKSHQQTAHIELQDTNKLNGLMNNPLLSTPNESLYIPFLPTTDSDFIKTAPSSSSLNTRTIMSNTSILLNSNTPTVFRPDILHSLDWNVILLTLIISSISLVLNTILIAFLSWRLSHHNKWRRCEHYSDIISYNSEEEEEEEEVGQGEDRCEQSSCKYKADRHSHHLSSNHNTTADFKCKFNSTTQAVDYPCVNKQINFNNNDPMKSKPRRLSQFWYHTNQPSEYHSEIYHNNGRHIKHVNLEKSDKVMINSQHLHVPNNFMKTSWAYGHPPPPPHHHHHHHRPPPVAHHEPMFCKAHEHLDVSSINDGSWHMVASDGVISDVTSDENQDGSLDSKTNSDILFSPRMKPRKHGKLLNKNRKKTKNKKEKTRRRKRKAQLMKRRCLNETLSESSINNLPSIHPHGHLHETYTNKQNKPLQMLNKTPMISDQFTCSNPHTTHISSDYKLRILRDSLIIYNRNVYVCHTLGIHLGILGALLSLLQLIAICIALVNRSTISSNKPEELYHISLTSEFICLITSSLASDAILCARLYLLVAFIIASLTVLYIKTIFKFLLRITRLRDIQLQKFYFYRHILQDYSKKMLSLNESGHHQRHSQYNIHHHQGFAYIALMHSLPWALAAGTALLIAFSFYTNNYNSDVFELTKNTTQTTIMDGIKSSSVNILFDGLDSLFTCSVRPTHESTLNTMYPHSSQIRGVKIPYTWIPSFLLIILPLIVQILIILSFILLIIIPRYKKSTSKYQLRISNNKIMIIILTILLIEIISLCTPILYNMSISIYPEERFKLILISRVIMLHLLADPLLMICLVEKYLKEDRIYEYTNKKHETLTSESMINMRSYSSNDVGDQLSRDPLNFTNEREMKVIENKDPLLLQNNKSLTSPVRLFSCFPVNPYSFSHNRTTNTIENIQPLVMPCLPASGFIVPAMNSASNSTPFNDSKLHNEMNSSGFLLPVTGNPVDVSSNMIANTLHNLYSGIHDNISLAGHHNSSPLRDTQLIGNFTSLSDNTSLTPEIDYSQVHTPTCRNMKDTFPQLCQHHQRLLEQQQYEQPPSANSTVRRNRNFGSVPRFKQTTVTDFNVMLVSKPTTDTTHQRSPSPSPTDNAKVENVNEIFSLQQLRQTTGQSTATAAVMAAAAAAVAAQAGTLSRTINPTISSTITTSTPTDPLSLTNGMPPSPLFVNEHKQVEQTLCTEKNCSDVNTVTN